MRDVRFGVVGAVALAALASGCEGMIPKQRPPSSGHVSTTTPVPSAGGAAGTSASIPSPVRRAPVVPIPEPTPAVETYTVVVNDVPVKELLFALARDAALNVDIHPAVEGNVTLNAVDQSLVQILDRITRQVDLRYELRRNGIFVGPDLPFLRTYKVDYVNMARNTTNTVKVSTGVIASQIGDGGGSGGSGDSGGSGSSGGANSETSVDSVSNNQFWETLTDTITQMIAGDERNQDADSGFVAEEAVIPNREAGILVVRATSRQHEDIQRYIDQVLNSSKRQVLIEATIVEVELSDAYQAGIDWAKIAASAGFRIAQSVITGGFGGFSSFLFLPDARGPTAELAYSSSPGDNTRGIDLTVRLLKSFGDTRVLSSPKIMALNNQTAVLQVVQNFVYFEIDSTVSQNDNNAVTATSTTARTVPVGVILAVTPQIDGSDQVTLNVRPTISRVIDTVTDPNPDTRIGVTNEVPVIAVREMESVLRVGSGQIAVLGGLMQDQYNTDTDDVPVLAETPGIGEAFRFRSQESVKSELVIFMRPWVIRSPDVRTDLAAFEPFLPESQEEAEPALSPIGEQLQGSTPPDGAAN